MYRESAARVKCKYSATAINTRSCSSFMAVNLQYIKQSKNLFNYCINYIYRTHKKECLLPLFVPIKVVLNWQSPFSPQFSL